jgi:hypothetical protein
MSYATMHDIHHMLETDRLDEPRQLIPVPVTKRGKSDERHASDHERKARGATTLAA